VARKHQEAVRRRYCHNGADMSPDFLYNISEPVDQTPLRKVAEDHATYG